MQMFVDSYGRGFVKTSDITRLDIIDELEKAARTAEDFAAGTWHPEPLTKSHLVDAPQRPATASLSLSREEIDVRILKVVQDGKIEPQYISKIHRDLGWLNTIPVDIRKSYGLPGVDENGLMKSLGAEDDVAKNRNEIGETLFRAVRDGQLDPRILGAFASHPEQTLAVIPEDILKSYGIPQPPRRALRTDQPPPWMTYAERVRWQQGRV